MLFLVADLCDRCHEKATCTEKHECVCVEGFEGDGIKECKGKWNKKKCKAKLIKEYKDKWIIESKDKWIIESKGNE